jgi:hypothetical protein
MFMLNRCVPRMARSLCSSSSSLLPASSSLALTTRGFSTDSAAKVQEIYGTRLQDKVAVITGGGSGIGRASSMMFASQGAAVVVADLNQEAGMETVQLIHEQGGHAVFIKTDVSKEQDCKAMVDCAESTFGKLNILFNNAGIMHMEV